MAVGYIWQQRSAGLWEYVTTTGRVVGTVICPDLAEMQQRYVVYVPGELHPRKEIFLDEARRTVETILRNRKAVAAQTNKRKAQTNGTRKKHGFIDGVSKQ
jgi:hypothetical protein